MIEFQKYKGSLMQENSDHLRYINNNCNIYNTRFAIEDTLLLRMLIKMNR